MKAERSIGEMFEIVRRDPDVWLEWAALELEDTGNPHYAWIAIRVCTKHKKGFPDWLLAYLGICAKRITSDEARKAEDLRKVLPWAFGFPNVFDPTQRKRGPGRLLDPDPDPDRSFALKFAIRLFEGETVPAAMRGAYDDVHENGDADDKTLERWLVKEIGLKERPSDADGWKAATREFYGSFLEFLRKKSRDSLS
jgi:hypothetical protein